MEKEISSTEPDWLAWARELQAIAQTGLAFTKNPYDEERYQRLRALASRLMAAHTATPAPMIAALFADEAGYATPKIDVRGAAFDAQGRILMVREVLDGGRWTLPGGWADVNLTPAGKRDQGDTRGERARGSSAQAGGGVGPLRGRGTRRPLFSCAKLFFVCEVVGGEAATTLETSEVGWFAEDALPIDLSLGRVLPGQLRRMFVHARDPALPTDYE